jgi:hypothetical protein
MGQERPEKWIPGSMLTHRPGMTWRHAARIDVVACCPGMTCVLVPSFRGASATSEPGIHSSNMSGGDFRIQIQPMRIAFFNQPDFPIAAPFFQIFLARNRGYGVVVDFKPDKSID